MKFWIQLQCGGWSRRTDHLSLLPKTKQNVGLVTDLESNCIWNQVHYLAWESVWMLERQDQNLCDKLRKIWKKKIESSQQNQESLSNLQKACLEWKVLENSRADTISLRGEGCGSYPQMLLPALKTSSITRGYSEFSSETKPQSLNLFSRIYT